MKKIALLAALFSASAFAAPVTQQGPGSTNNSFAINATVGDACRMSQAGDVTFVAPLYWTQDAATVDQTTSVKVECNTGAPFEVSFDGAEGDASVTLTNLNSNPLSGSTTLNATVTGQSTDTEVAGDGNSANTLNGYTKTLTVTVNRPDQANIKGSYSGNVTVVLSVVAPD